MGFFAVRFDNGRPERDPTVAPALVLRQEIPTARGSHPPFFMPDYFGYEYVANGDLIVVPADVHRSGTDLASIPVWLGWLAAKTGRNLPAALLHDVLIVDSPSQVNHWIGRHGEEFQRATEPYPRGPADAMFRDAMGDVGVDWFRRWIMWAGVTLGTLWAELPKGWRRIQAWVRALALALLGLFAGLWLLPNILLDWLDIESGWQVPGMGDRPWLEEGAGALGFLLLLSGLAVLLFAVGTRQVAHWQVGAMFVLTLFLLGWLIVFSYLQDLLFKVRLLLPRRSAVLSNPADQTATEGAMVSFEANVELRKGHRLEWIEESADGTVTRLDAAGPELEIVATPDKHGSTYQVKIYEENELVDQSFAATLTVDEQLEQGD